MSETGVVEEKPVSSTEAAEVTLPVEPSLAAKIWNGFVLVVLVAGGLLLGFVAALYIGLSSGWLDFC